MITCCTCSMIQNCWLFTMFLEHRNIITTCSMFLEHRNIITCSMFYNSELLRQYRLNWKKKVVLLDLVNAVDQTIDKIKIYVFFT